MHFIFSFFDVLYQNMRHMNFEYRSPCVCQSIIISFKKPAKLAKFQTMMQTSNFKHGFTGFSSSVGWPFNQDFRSPIESHVKSQESQCNKSSISIHHPTPNIHLTSSLIIPSPSCRLKKKRQTLRSPFHFITRPLLHPSKQIRCAPKNEKHK